MRAGELDGSPAALPEPDQAGPLAVPFGRELDAPLCGLLGGRIRGGDALGQAEDDPGYERGLVLSGS